MYVDHPPMPHLPTKQIIVIEAKDKPYTLFFVDEVIEKARMFDATSRDGDGDEIFWIVFDSEPKRPWDMTESALRSSLRRLKSERLPKEQLIALGDSAPIGEILETFDYGGLISFAQRDLPKLCRELEVTTLGEIAKLTRSEIRGPQCRYAGNKTLSYLDAVLREFGLPELRHFASVPLSDAENAHIAQHGLANF